MKCPRSSLWLSAILAIAVLPIPGAAQLSRLAPCLSAPCPDWEPLPRDRRIVVIGSSTAAGAGAPSPADSWVGRLSKAMAGKGVTVWNVSVIGSTTANSLDRFDRAVVPLNPDFVVLATSIMNERGFGNFPGLRQLYMQNTRQLIARVQAIGAIPILATPYPNIALNPALRLQMLEISREFESEGVIVWDFWSALDDGAGRWLPGLSSDGTHVGNTGHLSLFESIPLGFFDFALPANRPLPPRQSLGSWVADTAEGAQPAISVSPATPVPSWSAAFWTSSGGNAEERTLLEVSGPGVRVRRVGSRFELFLHGEVAASGAASTPGVFQHICLTHQMLTGIMTLYVNGMAVGAASAVGAEPARLFTLGAASTQPGIQGDSVSQFLTYRTPLGPEDVRELAAGRVPVKSLEAHLPLAQSPARWNQNAAPTVVGVVIAGTWHWVADGPRTIAAP